jgi:transcription elongation GreA/GreB family factor
VEDVRFALRDENSEGGWVMCDDKCLLAVGLVKIFVWMRGFTDEGDEADRMETLRYMRFFRNVWAHGRSEAESQLNAVENVAALAASSRDERAEGVLKTMVPPNVVVASEPPTDSRIPLGSRLAALHRGTGTEMQEYLRNEKWSTKVLKGTRTTGPSHSVFSTGEFCPEDVSIATDSKDRVGESLQQYMDGARTKFGRSWLKHEKEGMESWCGWVGNLRGQPMGEGEGGTAEDEEGCLGWCGGVVEESEAGAGSGEEEGKSQSLGTGMDGEKEFLGGVTDEDRAGSPGCQSSAWFESLENVTSPSGLSLAPASLGDESDVQSPDEEASCSKEASGLNRKRMRVSDEGVDTRSNRFRGMELELEPDLGSDPPFTFAQRTTTSHSVSVAVADAQTQTQRILYPKVRTQKGSSSSKRKGKGRAHDSGN